MTPPQTSLLPSSLSGLCRPPPLQAASAHHLTLHLPARLPHCPPGCYLSWNIVQELIVCSTGILLIRIGAPRIALLCMPVVI